MNSQSKVDNAIVNRDMLINKTDSNTITNVSQAQEFQAIEMDVSLGNTQQNIFGNNEMVASMPIQQVPNLGKYNSKLNREGVMKIDTTEQSSDNEEAIRPF